ncbi:SusC/RagA family TonB-linked outer membrane protein [Butyricimonas synergistica]|uniref:SusC/RagA family TonB-linked outer membrane protein n=1 Tax=Butyricimonas synergistica TaxID=544644 RepID=UPI00036DDEB4|nr:SusC/RagA family TonB-linked outer membrane protein [Butyricimonas synergistica]
MKLTLFMCCFFVLASFGNSLSQQRVSMSLGKTTIKEALTEFQRMTNMIVIYSDDNFEVTREVVANFKDVELDVFLKELLKGSGMTYKLMEDYILIMPSKVSVADSLNQLKKYVVRGVVKDEKGVTMPGVTVLIKETKVGVATDVDGKFELTTTDSSKLVLVFSFIGMKTTEVKYTGQKLINVTMQEDVGELEDVVVTGYANVRKTSFTGNSVQVNKEELMRVSSRNVVDALQVFDPSLRVMLNNEMGSDPNTLPEFYIRGQSGIGTKELDKTNLKSNPNAPVFILDGFEVSLEKVYDMDMNRIESMTILKDAAATAIYGSRAANGVIVIESVAPRAGKLNVSYNLVTSLTAPDLSDYNLMNAREKIEAEEAAKFYVPKENASSSEMNRLEQERLSKWDRVNEGVNTYWLGQPLQNQFNHKHSLYIDGGSENIRLGVDLKYDIQGGVMKESGRDKMGVGFYVDYRLKKLQVKNYITYDEVKAKASPYGNFKDYAEKLPYDKFKDDQGHYVRRLQQEDGRNGWHAPAGNLVNPLYEAKELSNFSKSTYNEITNNLSVNWYLLDNLQIKGQFTISKKNSLAEDFLDPLSGEFLTDAQYPGRLTQNKSDEIRINTNLFANYVNQFGKNNLNVSLGLNTVERRYESSSSVFEGFPSGHLHSPQYAAKEARKASFSDNHTRLFGTFFALNYTYDDIYLLDVSCRLDGSSEFGADKKFAPFWSGGVGLNVHKYEFMKENDLFSTLRFRITYGQTGKVNFPAYAAKHSYDLLEDWYDTGSGAILKYYGNRKLKWEVTNEFDVGMNVGLLKERIILKFDYYNKVTKDLITPVTVQTSTGFTSYNDNVGEIENRGVELDLRVNAIRQKDLSVVVYGNLAHNRNKILKISESLKAYNARIDEEFAQYEANGALRKDQAFAKPLLKYVEGGSLNSIFGMKSLGINPADGDEIFERSNGTITYTWFSPDQQIIGNKEPKVQGAFGLNVQYKNIFLYASFLYEFGGDVYNETLATKIEGVDLYSTNADRRVFSQRWQKPGDKAKFKSIQINNVATRSTSRFVQTNNTIKFNSLTVGYDFDAEWMRKIGLGMLRAQFSMKDIANISNVRQERGLSYPFARTFDFALNISF